jgi:U3 small nucleolar ribonucleoprotein component
MLYGKQEKDGKVLLMDTNSEDEVEEICIYLDFFTQASGDLLKLVNKLK